jgi:hypothetical protein
MRRRPLHLLAIVGLAGLLAPAAALVVELGARAREARGAHVLVAEPPELGWLPRPGHSEHNRWGFRDEAWSERPVPGWTRVAVLGDGATYGGEVPRHQTWVASAEATIRAAGRQTELLNMAVLGYDLVQVQALLASQVERFDPELLVYAWSPNDDLPSRAFELGDPPCPVALPHSPTITAGPLAALAFLRPHSAWYRRAEGAQLPDTSGAPSPSARVRAERFDAAWETLLHEAERQRLPLLVVLMPDAAGLAGEPGALQRHRRMRERAEVHATVLDGLELLDSATPGHGPLLGGQHPSARGHALLGQAAAQVLTPMLGASPSPDDTL